MDITSMLSKLQSMQSEMEKVKKEIAEKEVYAESGGGMVNVKMNGNSELISIDVADELFASNDKAMIQDLIVAAVNKAQRNASEMAKEEMNKISGMLPNIPGLNLNQ
jgi:DNA-binding YbaB/EbfC family protein